MLLNEGMMEEAAADRFAQTTSSGSESCRYRRVQTAGPGKRNCGAHVTGYRRTPRWRLRSRLSQEKGLTVAQGVRACTVQRSRCRSVNCRDALCDPNWRHSPSDSIRVAELQIRWAVDMKEVPCC